jgi:hypothetical protein
MIFRAYWPNDDAHQLAGDSGWMGVVSAGRPELLKEGFLADARNMRWRPDGSYGVRPGICALRWAGINGAPFLDQRILRAERYVHPTTRSSKVLLALSSGWIYTVSAGQGPFGLGTLPGPAPSEVRFAQTATGLVAFAVQEGVPATYVFDHNTLTWITPPAATVPGNEPLPPGKLGVYWQNRLFVLDARQSPERRDTIWVGDFGYGMDAYQGSSTYQSFRVHSPVEDEIVALVPFSDNRMLVFKRNSVHLVANVRGTNEELVANAQISLVTTEWGAAGPDAVVQHGPDVLVLSATRRGLMRLQVSDTGWVAAAPQPVSDRVQPWFDRINWGYTRTAQLTVHENRLYLAVPTGTATWNNSLFVFNFLTNEWESRDDLPVNGFVVVDAPGRDRVLGLVMQLPEANEFYDGQVAWLAEFREVEQDEFPQGSPPWWQRRAIPGWLRTRGYVFPEQPESRLRALTWMERGLDPRYQVTVNSGPLAQSRLVDVRERTSNGWLHPWDRPKRDANNAGDDAMDPARADYGTRPTGFRLGSGFWAKPRETHEAWLLRGGAAASHQVDLEILRGRVAFFGLRVWAYRSSIRSTQTKPA